LLASGRPTICICRMQAIGRLVEVKQPVPSASLTGPVGVPDRSRRRP
jgi:hypothetical protein